MCSASSIPTKPRAGSISSALGVDGTIRSDAAVSEFVEVLTALTPVRLADPRRAGRSSTPQSVRTGPTVVTGPPGAGTSEVALGLAAAIAARGEAAVLVDADELASSTAARLGLAIEPNLRNAIDAVEHGLGDLDGRARSYGSPGLRRGLRAAEPGRGRRRSDPATCSRWPVRSATSGRTCSSRSPVSRVSRSLERWSPTRACSSASVPHNPVGVTRLLGWAAALPAGVAPVHLVLNRAPTDRYRRAELTSEIYRTFTPASLTFVPSDRRVERAAWTGELVPRGPFTTGVAALAQTAVPRGARPAARSGGRAARAERSRAATT